MTDRNAQPRLNTRKLVIQLVAGMLTGMIVTYGALTFLDGRGFDIDDPSRMLALAIGLIFFLAWNITVRWIFSEPNSAPTSTLVIFFFT